jgi:putative DNA primase/helicase
VRAARPAMPDALNDRAADNWEPLAQIAGVAGGTWPEIATKAALHLSGDKAGEQGPADELLADVRTVFETLNVRRISMGDLLSELCRDEEAPWATWNKGHAMTIRQLGRMLAAYGVHSQTVKIGYESPKGYKAEQFADAFARYLPSSTESPVSPDTRSPSNARAGFAVTESNSGGLPENAPVTLKPLLNKTGDPVTERKGVGGEENAEVAGGIRADRSADRRAEGEL